MQRSVVFANDQTLPKKSASFCRLRQYAAIGAYGEMERQVAAPFFIVIYPF